MQSTFLRNLSQKQAKGYLEPVKTYSDEKHIINSVNTTVYLKATASWAWPMVTATYELKAFRSPWAEELRSSKAGAITSSKAWFTPKLRISNNGQNPNHCEAMLLKLRLQGAKTSYVRPIFWSKTHYYPTFDSNLFSIRDPDSSARMALYRLNKLFIF